MTSAGTIFVDDDRVADRLSHACVEALERHPYDVVNAWRHVGAIFGYQFIQRLGASPKEDRQPQKALREIVHHASSYRSREIAPERLERREIIREIVRSKYKNSAGIAWSDVLWIKLHELSRDGDEARALLEAHPQSVPNDSRTVGDVLGTDAINKIIADLRAELSKNRDDA